MTAFVLADLRDWRDRRMGRMVLNAAVVLAFAGLVGPLHPVALQLACAVVFVVSGWAEGFRYLSETASRRLILVFPRRPREIALAKVVSLLAVWSALALVFSPLLVASAIAWGNPLSFLAASLCCSLAAFLIAGSAGFLSCLLFRSFERPFGVFLLMSWTVTGFPLEWVRSVNPFFQILALSERRRSTDVFLGLALEALVAALLFILAIPAIGRARSRYHE